MDSGNNRDQTTEKGTTGLPILCKTRVGNHCSWSVDHYLTALMVLLAVTIFLISPFVETYVGRVLLHLFFSLILVLGILAVLGERILIRVIVLALSVISFSVRGLSIFMPNPTIASLNAVLAFSFYLILIWVVLCRVFGAGPISPHRICGAIASYLLLGGMWASLYELIALRIPQSFRMPERLLTTSPEMIQTDLFYFSFVTLTTLGYGDITAVHPLARTLVILEALVGQLFLAILLAGLVSKQIGNRAKMAMDTEPL